MSTRTTLFRPTILLAALAALALSMLYMTSPVLAADKETICHANSGVKEFVAITIDEGAATEPHLNNVNGSPLNGHEDDFLLQGEQTAEDCFNAANPSVPESAAESVPGSVPESEAESVPESEAESGEQSVAALTFTEEESVADGAIFGAGSSPLPTIAFSLILLASLGALAYANVKSIGSRI